MLEEIGRVALAVGREMAAGAASAPLEVAPGEEPGLRTGRERLAFLTEALPQAERALRAIAAHPRAEIRGQVTETPPERAKRPLPTARNRALLTASAANVSDPPSSLRLTVRGQILTTDIPENRYILRVIEQWLHDLREIRAQAAWEDDERASAQSMELEGRFRRMAEVLREMLRESPSPTAPVPERICAPSAAWMMDARYRVIYDLRRRYRRLFRFDWEMPLLRMESQEEWRLYEIWCFFQAASALRTLGYRARQGDAVVLSQNRLSIRLAKGQLSRLLFSAPSRRDTVALFYQRAYPAARAASSGIHSRTHAMIPDMTLERGGRLLLLDPKFRSYAEPGTLQEDINQMHVYRDALVKEGEPAVDGAWCLYPGSGSDGSRLAEAQIIAFPESSPRQPFGSAGVGAIRLRPGQTGGTLAALIREWMAQQETASGL
jgi:hypothetical protein